MNGATTQRKGKERNNMNDEHQLTPAQLAMIFNVPLGKIQHWQLRGYIPTEITFGYLKHNAKAAKQVVDHLKQERM